MFRWCWALVLAGCDTEVAVTPESNVAPTVEIAYPTGAEVFADDDPVELRGLVTDGNGLDDLQQVRWSSSIDGMLTETALETLSTDGTTVFPTTLTAGLHSITLEAVDVEGLRASDTITVEIEAAAQLPTATIDDPANLSEVEVGQPVGLTGTVADPNEDAANLAVTWTVRPASGGMDTELVATGPTAAGVTTADWTPSDAGNAIARLEVTDADGNMASEEIALLVVDPSAEDLDQDGVTVGEGDCDDDDPDRYPGNTEICDGIDNDCDEVLLSGEDVDNDTDGSPACADCDENDGSVFPGAPETCNGRDDSCSGLADDGVGTCPCPVTHFATVPYQVCSDAAVSWDEARTACAQDAGYILTVINGDLENDFVYAAIGAVLGANPGTYFWLGGSDAVQEGLWQWHNGQPWVFEAWAPDTGFGAEPNNSGGLEHYLEMGRTANSRWNDVAASSRNFYTCEYSTN